MAQRFSYTCCSIQHTDFREHMCRVSSLASTRFEPSPFFAQISHGLEEAFFGSKSHLACPKLTQNRVISFHYPFEDGPMEITLCSAEPSKDTFFGI